jgi:ABC-type multidrug transport system ATPase subunit
MLQISNLSKTYPNGVRALKGITLDIPEGMFGLLGPNGAGKSTLMRTIATLQEADEGAISFHGIDVLKEKDEVRRILGYLPQDFGLYPKVTPEAMLDHFAILKGITNGRVRREVVGRLLQMTNLYEVRKRKLGTFSGGMRQRFGIAQALLGDPRLIIVDEPTAGLDPEERNRFLNLLGEIGESIVVILSTHIVADVAELCRRMAIISGGVLLLTGDPRSIIAGLQGKIWQKMIDKNELERYKREHRVISTRWFGGRVIIHALSEGVPGEGFQPVEADLEDVYFSTLKNHQAA